MPRVKASAGCPAEKPLPIIPTRCLHMFPSIWANPKAHPAHSKYPQNGLQNARNLLIYIALNWGQFAISFRRFKAV